MSKLLAAVLAAAMSLVPFSAQAITFDFEFDNTFDGSLSPPIVGTGTLTFDGDPGNGDFALTSLANYAFDFNFDSVLGSFNFGTADIQTSISSILVRIEDISGGRRSVSFDSDPLQDVGSLEFVNGSYSLSFQSDFGQLYQTDHPVGGLPGGTFAGIVEVAPVPLPAAGILLLASLSGMGLLARRRKAA